MERADQVRPEEILVVQAKQEETPEAQVKLVKTSEVQVKPEVTLEVQPRQVILVWIGKEVLEVHQPSKPQFYL